MKENMLEEKTGSNKCNWIFLYYEQITRYFKLFVVKEGNQPRDSIEANVSTY